MAKFLLSITLLAVTAVHINAQYGDYGKEVVKEEVKEGVLEGGKYGVGYGKEVITKEIYPVKEVAIKPAVVKPAIIPFAKPVVTSYQKFPAYGGYGGGYAGHGVGFGGGYGGHGIGGGYGGYGGYGGGYAGYGGKVIPITKLHEYQPKLDINQFLKPYDGAHLLQKYGKTEHIVKHAPPVFIKQPPIEKTVIQDVYVKQPVIVYKQPVIHKKQEVVIKKAPAVVKINEKVPIDVKDFGQTAVVKEVGVEKTIHKNVEYGVKEPIIPKEVGYGGEKVE